MIFDLGNQMHAGAVFRVLVE